LDPSVVFLKESDGRFEHLCDAPVEAALRLLIDGHVVVVPERVAVSRQLLDAAQRPTKRRNARAEITKYGPAPSAADSAMVVADIRLSRRMNALGSHHTSSPSTRCPLRAG